VNPYEKGKRLSGKEKMNDSDEDAIFYYEKAAVIGSSDTFLSLARYHLRGLF